MPDAAEPIQSADFAGPSVRAPSTGRRMADAVRAAATDLAHGRAADAAFAVGMADACTALWTRLHKFDAADPLWTDRDRFVVCPPAGGPLLEALLHLTGATSKAAPHPAVEIRAGGAGEALGVAVGLALAERLLAARFGKSLVDHRTWAVVSDDDLAAGVAQEVASLAGALRLEKLTVLWHETEAAPAGTTDDIPRRFAASGWATRRVDAQDGAELASALAMATRSKKPSLIACRADPAETAPWLDPASKAAHWPHPPMALPEPIAAAWHAAGARGASARRGWLKRLARHASQAEFERVQAGRLPDLFHETVAAMKLALARGPASDGEASATRQALDLLSDGMPELVGATTAQASVMVGLDAIAPGGMQASLSGRVLRAGARAQGMAAIANGIALHGGAVPFGAGLMRGADAIRPALRRAAEMRQRVVHTLLQEADAAPPPDHLASLRAMPNLHLFRPADPLELAECLELAFRRADGPSVLMLSLPAPPALRADVGENRCVRGGYVLAEADGPRQACLIATGAEVAIAAEARALLAADAVAVAVVSLPCWELFAAQDEAYRAAVLGGAPRFGIEGGSDLGWDRWLGPEGQFLGAAAHSAEAIAAAVRRRLAASSA